MVIEILAGTPAGGGQDRAARALAAALAVDTSVTNIPGRGGGNAWDRLMEHAGDPGVVAISSPTIITNKPLGVATIDDRDLTPLAQLCTEYLAFAVATESPLRDARHAAARLAAADLSVSLAVARGNVNHMALGSVIARAGGAPTATEPRVFDSARYAVADVLAGESDVAVVSAASVIPELEAGRIRVLAMSSAERLPAPFAGVPTWTEVGNETVIGTWRGLVGPPELTPGDVSWWDEVVTVAVAGDPWQRSLAAHAWTPTHLGGAATRIFLDDQRRTLTAALVGIGVLQG
jgi:putative tricarboxylic transport membrane protein